MKKISTGPMGLRLQQIAHLAMRLLACKLANAVGNTTLLDSWTAAATGVQTAANDLLRDSAQNLFKGNESSAVYPQDGNSYTPISALASNATQVSTISAALAVLWEPHGAPTPEAGATISPFVSGFEARSHFPAGHSECTVALVELMWSNFLLDDPRMMNSTGRLQCKLESFGLSWELFYAGGYVGIPDNHNYQRHIDCEYHWS